MATIKLSIKVLLKLLEEILVFKCEYCAGSLLGGGGGGVRGHAPPKIFECVDAISCILRH